MLWKSMTCTYKKITKWLKTATKEKQEDHSVQENPDDKCELRKRRMTRRRMDRGEGRSLAVNRFFRSTRWVCKHCSCCFRLFPVGVFV